MNSNNTASTVSFAGGASDKPWEPELFARDKLTETPQANHHTLARNPRTGREMSLPDEVMNAISYLDCFKTLDEHVQGFLQEGPGREEQARAIASVIKSIQQGGLTVSAREICERLAVDGEAGSPAPHPVVAIITCERPLALQRLLESIVAECDLGRTKRCVVIDDSRSVENQQKNRRITTRFNELADVEFTYFGANEANQFMTALIRRLPEFEEQIRFLIDRDRWKDYFSVGVARNFSLLLSAGDPLIVFDDDTVCKAYESLFVRPEVEFSDRPRQAQFFPSNTSMTDLDTSEIADPVQQHMRCLGLSLSAALNVLGLGTPRQSSVRHARPEFATSLHAHSKILVTECGTYGDPGTVNNNWLAGIPVESRERLLRSANQFDLALNERSCWLGVSQANFRSRAVISQLTGFDNRELLPPYFPIERGEDRLFGDTVRLIYPESLCLNYPWAISHLPIPPRQLPQEGRNFSSANVSVLSLLARANRSAGACTAEDAAARLEHLAQSLQIFATSPKNKVLGQFAQDCSHIRKRYLSLLQQTLEDSREAPSFWTDYMQRSIQQAQKTVQPEADLDVLTPSNGTPGGQENIEFWQAASAEFGQSMLAWSTIVREARTMIKTYPASSA